MPSDNPLNQLLTRTGPEGQARHVALAAAAARLERAEPTALVGYASRGAVLIIGPEADALDAAGRLPGLPRRVVLATAPATEGSGAPEDVICLHGRLAGLAGHLGGFSATAETTAGVQDLTAVLDDGHNAFDLVLDLQPEPALADRVAPPGYYAPATGAITLEAALDELPGLVGEFEKPTYFHYDPDLCAHGRRGVTACTRCIDACPTRAITSLGDQVAVDPRLCQGFGTCASACPSGAIRYSQPSLQDSLEALRALLWAYRESGGATPRLLIHDRGEGLEWLIARAAELPESVVPFAVEEAGSLGLEAWLGALAYGAAEVMVLFTPATAPLVRAEMERQAGVAGALLEGMGHGAERVRTITAVTVEGLVAALGEEAAMAPVSAAAYRGTNSKREMAFWALDHLHKNAPEPRPLTSLPAGAPFGTAQVDAQSCTLCLSCVGVCPGRALQDGYDRPQLNFIEANCLQCGMCTRVCPEDAIWISPRLLFDPQARSRPRVLHEEEPFHCVSCGKPFATRKVVDRMTEKLRGHWMYQDGRAMARLQMCEDCRVRSLFDEQGGQFISPGRPSA